MRARAEAVADMWGGYWDGTSGGSFVTTETVRTLGRDQLNRTYLLLDDGHTCTGTLSLTRSASFWHLGFGVFRWAGGPVYADVVVEKTLPQPAAPVLVYSGPIQGTDLMLEVLNPPFAPGTYKIVITNHTGASSQKDSGTRLMVYGAFTSDAIHRRINPGLWPK